MTTRKQKQVAYNERVSAAEDEISKYNCDIAGFLSGLNATESITIALNAGDSVKRGEAILGGQYWKQEGRAMTAVNRILDGMPNTRTSAVLSAAVEAVTWKHPIETVSPDGKRISPRMIFYPRDMPQIAEELDEYLKNPSELEDGKHIAYSVIVEKAADYADIPKFYCEDCEMVQNDSVLSAAIPQLLNTAAQVSVGSRDFVLEIGPDVMNSSDEDLPYEEYGEELTRVYTSGLKAPVVLSQSEVARQRAAAEGFKKAGWGKWIDSDAIVSTSTTSDFSQSAPSSPAMTLCPSRFDEPDTPKSQKIPRAKTPTGEVPPKPTVLTAVTMPPLSKEPKRQRFLVTHPEHQETNFHHSWRLFRPELFLLKKCGRHQSLPHPLAPSLRRPHPVHPHLRLVHHPGRRKPPRTMRRLRPRREPARRCPLGLQIQRLPTQ
jgi:hypothetical protein